MIKVGLIGVGFIGNQHIEAIRRISNVELVAVSDRNLDKLKLLSNQNTCKRIYTDYREMIKKEELDVVHNCLPTNMHFEVNKYIIENDINVYCEKPLVRTLDEAKTLNKLLKNKNVFTGVNFNYRHNAMVQEMRVRVKNREIGRPLLITGLYLQDWLMFKSDYDWRMDSEIGGYSRALSDIGSHCFDLAEYVLGDKIKKVNATLFKSFDEREKRNNISTFSQTISNNKENYQESEKISVDNEDGGIIQVEFDSGLIGVFIISQISAGKKNDLELNISGSDKALEWKQEKPDRLWIGNRLKGNEEIYVDVNYLTGEAKKYATLPNGHAVGWHDALTNAIRSFYNAIELDDNGSNDNLFATFEDGYNIMKIVDACLISDKEKKWIEVN